MVKKYVTRALAVAACALLPLSGFAGEKVDHVSKIHNDVSKFNGKQVELKGEVEDIRGSYAFVLEGEGFINDEILVVSKKPLSEYKNASVTDGSQLTAVGTIRQFGAMDAEREMGWQLDPSLRSEWTSTQTVLVLSDLNPSVTQPVAEEVGTDTTERAPASIETDTDTSMDSDSDFETVPESSTEDIVPESDGL